MMASNSGHPPPPQRAPPLARHNSSFLGAIKTLVNPLKWFAPHDAHPATPGKRRRPLEQQPTEDMDAAADDSELGIALGPPPSSAESDDGGTRRSKRMRLHSPPRQPYLDPPAASLRRAEPQRRASVIPRASSAVLPSSTSGRATLSPRRQHFPVARTMSIDPPYRPLVRHDSSAFNFGPPPSSAESDYDMAVDFGEGSVPPSPRRSPRPSFRMRSSVTPQPQFARPPTRYISEPPPLNSLISNPVFLHPPAPSAEPPAPAPTLGSLVDSVRTTKSPTRQQHSSLLFQNPAHNEPKDPPAERALHQLDVYKTPLLPTRMRSSNLPESVLATTTPDMFTSRRRKRLVLMSDDRDRLGKKGVTHGKSPVANETKPYAGDGALRKLLARRKQETEDEGQQQPEKEAEAAEGDATPRAPSPPRTTRSIPPPPPVPTGPDWFSTASSSSSDTGSSLRIGRTKTSRNHFQRPSKSRYSAIYEEEPDDSMSDESQRQKEFKMLEEAAKAAPVFSIAPGFSFAKDTAGPVNIAESEKAKEPPLTSLPFTFTKPAETTFKAPSAPSAFPSFGLTSTGTAAPSSLASSKPMAPPVMVPVPVPEVPRFEPPAISVPSVPSASSGVPNFFANSSIVKEASIPTPPPVLSFAAATTTTTPSAPPPSGFFSLKSTAPVSTPSKVVNDKENPFWDGDEKKAVEEKKGDMGVFSGFGKPAGGDSGSTSAPSLFGGAPSVFGTQSKPVEQQAPSAPAPTQQPFSFGKPAQVSAPEAPSTTLPTSVFGTISNTTAEAPKAPFSFGPAVDTKKSESEPKSVFGGNNVASSVFGDASASSATSNLFGDASKPASTSNLFGDASKSAQTSSLFGQPATTQASPAASPFSFGAPASAPAPTPAVPAAPTASAPPTSQPNFFANAASTTAPAVEAPKSMFGTSSNASPFSFGQPNAPAEKKEEPTVTAAPAPAPAPFSFGAAPSTPPTPAAAPKPAMFSFGQPAPAPSVPAAHAPAPAMSSAPAPMAFSFSGGGGAGGSANADVSSRPFFGFGQPNPVAAAARPVTPPPQNNDNEFKMEESPTRDLQLVNGSKPPDARPTIGGGGFSFGNSSNTGGSSLFGGQGTASSGGPFAFAGPSSSGFGGSSSSNPFAPKENEVQEPKPFGGFGQAAAPVAPAIQTSFSFGQPAKSPEDGQRPNTGGGFTGFGTTPTSATAPTNTAFSFGAPAASNPFGQPGATNSAPSSPSTFNQPAAFSFGTSAAPPSNAFAFGSQPASPASGGNLSLPASGFGSGGGFGQQQQQQPSSPFSAPALLTPSTSSGAGGNLFTIGSAPQPAPGSAGRAIKKLPTRRGAVKR